MQSMDKTPWAASGQSVGKKRSGGRDGYFERGLLHNAGRDGELQTIFSQTLEEPTDWTGWLQYFDMNLCSYCGVENLDL